MFCCRAALLLAAVALGLWSVGGVADAQDGARAVAITVGEEHACALLRSGEVECWGGNWHGQADAPAGGFTQIDAGQNHTCGLRESGEVEC